MHLPQRPTEDCGVLCVGKNGAAIDPAETSYHPVTGRALSVQPCAGQQAQFLKSRGVEELGQPLARSAPPFGMVAFDASAATSLQCQLSLLAQGQNSGIFG
jgi:hypothetical protein